MQKIITIFGSALLNNKNSYYKNAVNLGKDLANNNYTICTGGYSGIMEAVSKGAKSLNGNTIGVTLDNIKRIPNEYLDENVIMPNWVERLMELIAIGDAYIFFKGGSGTLVELSAVIEMMNKKIMKEKYIICYRKYWEKVINSIKKESDKLSKLIDNRIVFTNSNTEILKLLKKFKI